MGSKRRLEQRDPVPDSGADGGQHGYHQNPDVDEDMALPDSLPVAPRGQPPAPFAQAAAQAVAPTAVAEPAARGAAQLPAALPRSLSGRHLAAAQSGLSAALQSLGSGPQSPAVGDDAAAAAAAEHRCAT